MEIKSLRNNVLVKVLPQKNRTYKSVIHLPDSAMKEVINFTGIVESVGNGIRSKKGKRPPLDLKQGDMVMFPRHTGVRLMIENVEYRYVKVGEIICVLEE